MIDRPTQLSLAVFLREQCTFDNFIAENDTQKLVVHALERISEESDDSNILLWGELGTGLSHLLQATCKHASESGFTAQYLPLAEFLEFDADAVLSGLANLNLLCVDDIELCTGDANWEQGLFHLYNQLKAQGGKLVCSMHVSPQSLGFELADLRSRILSAPTFKLTELSDDGKVEALTRRAESMAMELPPEVANYLINRVSRKSDNLFSLLNQLERASMAQQRKLTIPFVKQELALHDAAVASDHKL